MRYQEVQLESIGELVEALKGWPTEGGPLWFRGQSNKKWGLVPSLFRYKKGIEGEGAIIKVFKQQSRPYLLEKPITEWEWLFLMQHHRLPTRLLDWSESPLVGLYFALADRSKKRNSDDAALWVLDPVALNKNAGHNRLFPKELLAFGADDVLDTFLPAQVNSKAPAYPVAAIGPRNSARMVAQSGTFTIAHADPTPLEKLHGGSHVWRMIIPPGAKDHLRQELALLGVGEDTLFPDLDRVADAAVRLLLK
jgi:hypothetical protein